MATGRDFTIQLDQWAKRFAGDMDALARQVCQEIANNVVTDTPVDTGFLRSSWQPSIGAPASSNGNNNGNPITTVAAVAQGVRAGDVFYMINNAEYAPHVEFGTSKMAGRFFLTRNVKRAPSVVAKLAQELG